MAFAIALLHCTSRAPVNSFRALGFFKQLIIVVRLPDQANSYSDFNKGNSRRSLLLPNRHPSRSFILNDDFAPLPRPHWPLCRCRSCLGSCFQGVCVCATHAHCICHAQRIRLYRSSPPSTGQQRRVQPRRPAPTYRTGRALSAVGRSLAPGTGVTGRHSSAWQVAPIVTLACQQAPDRTPTPDASCRVRRFLRLVHEACHTSPAAHVDHRPRARDQHRIRWQTCIRR